VESAEILDTHSAAPAPKLFRDRPRLATVRSKVTNGRRVFAIGGDGRGAWTRRWKDIVELHVAGAGGRDYMSEAMLSLCRRAATLEIQLEQLECCMSEGEDVDIEIYGRIASHLRRILETLGVERKPRPVNDGSQALAEYFSRPPPKEGAAP
jgi:hypothetical protein